MEKQVILKSWKVIVTSNNRQNKIFLPQTYVL